MKTLLLALVPTVAFAFDSTVSGIGIANTHEVAPGIYRGSEPGKKIQELKDFGVETVIIFKSQTKTEVDDELSALKDLSIKTHHIPFKWKDLESTEVACEQVVKAMQVIRREQKAGRIVFFHCTVGEDRTGLLAGLTRMEQEGISTNTAWKKEMCPHGYADGNTKKPYAVSSAIHKELTPLFLALAAKIEGGEKLTLKSCHNLRIAPSTKTCRR